MPLRRPARARYTPRTGVVNAPPFDAPPFNDHRIMDTLELRIDLDDAWHELLIAELLDLDVEAFQQDDGVLRAFVPAARWDDVKREQVEAWLLGRGLAVRVQEHVIAPQNWNRQWEETIRPIAVGPFLVKPTWADVPAGDEARILLEIDPKMSFGTGYHESTRLALRFLPEVVRGGERVLDAGTGTGILAIGALKLGAASAVAFDTDEWAQENAVENFYLNGVAALVAFRAGAVDVVPEAGFDLILANIHRSVLIELLPVFARKVAPGGRVVLAGLLRDDAPRMREEAARHGFGVAREEVEGDWWAAVLVAGSHVS